MVKKKDGKRRATAGNGQKSVAEVAPPNRPQESESSPEVKSSPMPAASKPKEKPLPKMIAEAKDDSELRRILIAQAKKILTESPTARKYHCLLLYSNEMPINRYVTDRIYTTLRSCAKDKDKPILLIVLSNGGSVESAYLVSKACKEYAKERFAVAIPRHAKSAATLLGLGADEIHMGIMSELGPIDPQVGEHPALALKHALENISQLCETYPKAATMFSEYLAKTLKITTVGYYERISESAVQYAERLLSAKYKKNAHALAWKLVYAYKDHGFVIDHEEALRLFSDSLIKYETDEYHLAEKVHQLVEEFDIWLQILKKRRVSWIMGQFNLEGIYISSLDK